MAAFGLIVAWTKLIRAPDSEKSARKVIVPLRCHETPKSLPLPSFDTKMQHLIHLLEAEDEISDSISSALDELQTLFPQTHIHSSPKGSGRTSPTVASASKLI
jgi:hypothetical protein